MGLRITPGSTAKLRLGFALLCVVLGLGVCAIYGNAWMQIPHGDGAQLDTLARVEAINQIARDPTLAPKDTAAAEALLVQARERVVARIDKQRKNLLAGLAAGGVLLIVGIGQWFASRAGRRG